jgi:cell division protein FtsB
MTVILIDALLIAVILFFGVKIISLIQSIRNNKQVKKQIEELQKLLKDLSSNRDKGLFSSDLANTNFAMAPKNEVRD